MTGDSVMVPVKDRRRFTKAEKEQICLEYQSATCPEELGMVLRRWGTYQQNVSRWSKEFGMTNKKNARKGRGGEEARLAKQLAATEARLAKSQDRVELLEELVAAQGKVLEGLPAAAHAKNAGSPDQG